MTKTVLLEDVVDFQEGPGVLTKDFHETGVPLIRIKGLETPIVSLDGCDYLDPQKVENKWSHFRLSKGDFLVTTSGTLGRVSEVDDTAVGAIPYTGIIKFRTKVANLDPRYLKHYLSSVEFKNQTESMATGSVLRHYGPSHLRKVKIVIPDLVDQKKAAAILDSIDQKIELNRRINETLEKIGQTLFKHYFITNPERKNWEKRKIGKFIEICGGGTPSTKNPVLWNGDVSWTSPRDLTGKSDTFLFETGNKITQAGLNSISSKLLPAGTLLLSSRAPIGYLVFAGVPMAINQGYIAFSSGKYLNNEFMYFWLKRNMDIVKNAANGSTFMEISKGTFRNLATIIPPQKLVAGFSKDTTTLFEKMKNNQLETVALVQLRDSLLPRLISGKINA